MRKVVLALLIIATVALSNSYYFMERGVLFTVYDDGYFTYSCNSNCNVSTDMYGNINRINSISISYNMYGDAVERIGSVSISYDMYGKYITRIGGMSITHGLGGNITTYGRIK